MRGEISRADKVADFLEVVLISEDKLYIHWQLQKDKVHFIRKYFNLDEEESFLFLRLYSKEGDRDEKDVHEVVLPKENESWLFKGLGGNRSYLAEIGIYRDEGYFFPLLRSNTIPATEQSRMAADFTSDRKLPEWTANVSTYTYYEKL